MSQPLSSGFEELSTGNESEVRLRSVLAGMLDPVVLIDPAGTILEANDSCSRVFGWTPDELVGRNVRVLMPEPYRSEHDDYLSSYRSTGRTNILGRCREFPAVHRDGREISVELSVSRIDVPGKDEPIFCGSFRDVTDRKEAELALLESERRFRAIFDGEFQFVGLLDVGGRVLEVNRTVLERTGVAREQVLGRPFWEPEVWFPTEEDRRRARDAVERAARGEFVRFEMEMRPCEREAIDVDFSIKPLLDENGAPVLLIPEGRDISGFKAAQRREVAMMRAFAEIGESASVLAHEIKNPITSVNLALRAVAKQLGEDEREVLEGLVVRMRRLEKLMRRTLSLARPLQARIESCDPLELGRAVEQSMGEQCQDAGVALEVDCRDGTPPFLGDRELMEEALQNLVRNAVEALGERGGRVRLALAPASPGLVISVEDDGPGVPESVRDTIFKPFVTTRAAGTGIGLALVRKIVEAHGGTIALADGELGGARFEIRLG